MIVVDRGRPHLSPDTDPWSTLVYAARGTDVCTTVVDGRVLVEDFALVEHDVRAIAAEGRHAARTLAARASAHGG